MNSLLPQVRYRAFLARWGVAASPPPLPSEGPPSSSSRRADAPSAAAGPKGKPHGHAHSHSHGRGHGRGHGPLHPAPVRGEEAREAEMAASQAVGKWQRRQVWRWLSGQAPDKYAGPEQEDPDFKVGDLCDAEFAARELPPFLHGAE